MNLEADYMYAYAHGCSAISKDFRTKLEFTPQYVRLSRREIRVRGQLAENGVDV